MNVANLIPSFLMCLVPVIGIVVTAMARHTQGRAAIIGMLGCVALLLSALTQVGQVIYLSTLVARGGYTVISIISLLTGVLSLTGISLLIWAVVARRPAVQPQQPAWQQPQSQQASWQSQGQQAYGQPPQGQDPYGRQAYGQQAQGQQPYGQPQQGQQSGWPQQPSGEQPQQPGWQPPHGGQG